MKIFLKKFISFIMFLISQFSMIKIPYVRAMEGEYIPLAKDLSEVTVDESSDKELNPFAGATSGVDFQRNFESDIFGDGTECKTNVKYGLEYSTIDPNTQEKIYKKTALANFDFYRRKENDLKKVLTYKLKVIFTYDKKSFVKIEDPLEDVYSIKEDFRNDKWRIMECAEVFPMTSLKDPYCIVSGQCIIYKNATNSKVYSDNTHMDFICTKDGDITFNTKAVSDIEKNNIKMKENIVVKEGPTYTKNLSNNINRQEKTYYISYLYGDNFVDNPTKYVTIRKEIVYYDNLKNQIASAFMESNFRYNNKLKSAKCLSTFHEQICSNPKADIKVFQRTKNASLNRGESYGEINFSYDNKKLDSPKYIFCCDNQGNLSERL